MMSEKIDKLIDELLDAMEEEASEGKKCPLDAIREKVAEPALYENLAEEASEVAHAALKVARIMRGENPTPLKIPQAMSRLKQEVCDLFVVCDVLGISGDYDYMFSKIQRWLSRLEELE